MMDEAQELALIRSILVDTFPEASQRVGKTNLNDIVRRRGQVRIAPMIGASNLDWTVALSLLASSATILSHCLIVTRNNLDPREDGRTEWNIHFHQTSEIHQEIRIDRVEGGSRVSVGNEIEFVVPAELADQVDPATLDRLIAALVSHLAANRQGSPSRETN
ncbi:hypothetical protein [Longimicrobium sp.]|uniref:hypothetical protein n=1 Tax=Longimicrobium sp. TaxID=2029185 RepID=UPI003B3B205E